MYIKNCYLTLLVMFLVLPVFSQTWEDDSLVVRQILDTNGLDTVPVEKYGDISCLMNSRNIAFLKDLHKGIDF